MTFPEEAGEPPERSSEMIVVSIASDRTHGWPSRVQLMDVGVIVKEVPRLISALLILPACDRNMRAGKLVERRERARCPAVGLPFGHTFGSRFSSRFDFSM